MTSSGFCNACGAPAPAEALRCAACGALLPPRDDPRDPRRVAHALAEALGPGYEVVEEVGRGGFARVFKVRDVGLDRWLAVKAIAPELMASPEATLRFRAEVLTVARLLHPNIVPIYFVPDAADLTSYVMPLVDGESLATRERREGALPLAVAAGITLDVAAALEVAHAAGIIHRDVKPDNVLLDERSGRAMLTDFGIAYAPRPGSRLTATGQILGTPLYAAPEQGAGERVLDGRVDEYSLGVVLFEMLAGRLPFEAPGTQALLALRATAPRPDVRSWRPEVPAAVAAALQRALAEEPEARFPTVGAFAEAVASGLGRRSLRVSGAAWAGPPAPAGASPRGSGTVSAEGARAALLGAEDVVALKAAVAGAQKSLDEAVLTRDGARAAAEVFALVAARADAREGFRDVAGAALRRCAGDAGVVETLAQLWLRPESGAQATAEQALADLMPDAGAALIALARRERRAEFLLLADRTGALGDQEVLALARDRSAGVAALLVGALVESQRAPEAVERWLGAALEHPRSEVRRAALAAAAQRGGALAERLGRSAVRDADAAVRLAALETLAASRRKEAIPDLAAVLDSGGEAEQVGAARALGRLGVPEALGPLQGALARRRLLGLRAAPVAEAAVEAIAWVPGLEAAAALEALRSRGGNLGSLARKAVDRRQ